MSVVDIVADEFQPANDPAIGGPSAEGALRNHLSEDSSIVGPDELHGLTVSDAEDAYIGLRRAEATNGDFPTGTKHQRARWRYGQLLDTDRAARALFENPAVGMQTLVIDPTLSNRGLGPIEQAVVATEGATRAVRRTRDRIQGDQFVYFGVRDIDTDGLSHWHVYWCVDQSEVEADSLDLLAGVDAHVRHTREATDVDHPATEAVKWDGYPGHSVEPLEADVNNGGGVHPLARYVAGNLPHSGVVGKMNPQQVRHGAVEWASTEKALKRRCPTSVSSEFGRLVGG